MNGLEGKTAIVNGGFDEIGVACAKRLADNGAKVILTALEEERSRLNKEKLPEQKGVVEHYTLQEISENEIEEFLQYVEKKVGLPSILINNAAILREEALHKTHPESIDSLIDQNLKFYIDFLRLAIPLMVRSGSGSVVNISSVQGIRGRPLRTVFGAAMGGMISLTRGAAVEYANSEIRFNTIVSGIIKTDEYKKVRAKSEPEFERKLIRHIPMGRLGKPSEIAALATFLSGPDSSYITGAVIPVDGGFSAM